jgi:peptidyl-prolyl cis-trans isomerase A (cyclophilin A)
MRHFLILAALVLTACSPRPEETSKQKTDTAPQKPPEIFDVKLDTSKGNVLVRVHRAWAPKGADHFHYMVRTGFYDGARFFRVRPGFVVQFGINGDPSVSRLWKDMYLTDDPVKESNRRGTLSYAMRGPNTRTTQVFINLTDNKRLDKDGFAPFAEVVEGMDVVDAFYSAYGETAPRGNGPSQDRIFTEGNAYLERYFPRLDYIRKATLQ